MSIDEIFRYFIILWAVVDPVGTVPVFIAVTKRYNANEKIRIANTATLTAFAILIFFFFAGSFILKNVGVPLPAFQISGGVILFLFASNMIFGNSKPEEEIQLVKKESETAIFPLAIPSIASPGAIMALVLLAENPGISYFKEGIIILILTLVLIANYFMMRLAGKIHNKIGNAGAIVISKVMGLIIASMAANNILMGIKQYFKIS